MENKKEQTVRGQVYMPRELKQWLEDESQRTGLTQNALMLTAINNYRESCKRKVK